MNSVVYKTIFCQKILLQQKASETPLYQTKIMQEYGQVQNNRGCKISCFFCKVSAVMIGLLVWSCDTVWSFATMLENFGNNFW